MAPSSQSNDVPPAPSRALELELISVWREILRVTTQDVEDKSLCERTRLSEAKSQRVAFKPVYNFQVFSSASFSSLHKR